MAGQRTDGSRAGTEEVRQELPPTQPTADKGPGKLTELDRQSWWGVLRRVHGTRVGGRRQAAPACWSWSPWWGSPVPRR